MILGLHCSVRDGFDAALGEAVALGCEAMQMLPYRRHHEPTGEEIAAFNAARAQSPVKRLLIHSRFVPSLGSSDERRWLRSVAYLSRELGLAAALGAEAFVLHAGAYSEGVDVASGVQRVVEGIARAASKGPRGPLILLENVPGGGRRMGGNFEELAALFSEARRRGIGAGLCLDTAHAWAAGDDLSSSEGMLKWLAKAHRLFGSDNVRAFHLNDTRALLGSHREHHWHWGRGYLGAEGLKTLLVRPEYQLAVGIIETPKSPEDDVKNLAYVRSLQGKG